MEMQEEMDKELLKQYNITECYVCLSRYDAKEYKQTIVSRPKEGTPILFSFVDENEREKIFLRNVSTKTRIHVGIRFCVGEFKKYLTQREYRAKILAKLNANSKLKLKSSSAETNCQYQVNEDLVRMILQTAMHGHNVYLDYQGDMIKKAIEIAENQILMEQMSCKVSRIKSSDYPSRIFHQKNCSLKHIRYERHGNKNKSRKSPLDQGLAKSVCSKVSRIKSPDSTSRIFLQKNCSQKHIKSECHGNKNKPRKSPFDQGLAKSVSPWCEDKAKEIQQKMIASNIQNIVNEYFKKCDKSSVTEERNTSSCRKNDFQPRVTSTKAQSAVKSRVNDDIFRLNDNSNETSSSIKSSVNEDNFLLNDNQQHLLTKNQTKDEFLHQHPIIKKDILRSKKSAQHFKKSIHNNGNEQTKKKVNTFTGMTDKVECMVKTDEDGKYNNGNEQAKNKVNTFTGMTDNVECMVKTDEDAKYNNGNEQTKNKVNTFTGMTDKVDEDGKYNNGNEQAKNKVNTFTGMTDKVECMVKADEDAKDNNGNDPTKNKVNTFTGMTDKVECMVKDAEDDKYNNGNEQNKNKVNTFTGMTDKVECMVKGDEDAKKISYREISPTSLYLDFCRHNIQKNSSDSSSTSEKPSDSSSSSEESSDSSSSSQQLSDSSSSSEESPNNSASSEKSSTQRNNNNSGRSVDGEVKMPWFSLTFITQSVLREHNQNVAELRNSSANADELNNPNRNIALGSDGTDPCSDQGIIDTDSFATNDDET